MKNKKNIYSSVFFIILALGYLLGTKMIKNYNAFVSTGVSSKTIPRILGGLLLLLSIVQLIGERQKATVEKDENIEQGKARKGMKEVLLTFGTLILYVVLLEPLGFILASIIFLILQMFILTYRDDRKDNIVKVLILSLVFPLIIYFIFTKGLGLILPRGLINI